MPDLNNLKILVADNDQGHQDTIRNYLIHLPIQIDTARNGKQVLASLHSQAASDHPYDIAILSAELPLLDSFSVANTIINTESISKTRLILIVNPNDNLSSEKILQSGFSAFIAKPVESTQLMNAITTITTITTSTATNISTPKILLAEDNIINAKLAMLQLQKLGYAVTGVTNGQEAIDALARGSYALILMDCQMPIVDGYEASRRIRHAETITGSHIPIVAMTANALQVDRDACTEAGMDDFLGKPMKPDQIKQVIDKWVKSSTTFTPKVNLGPTIDQSALQVLRDLQIDGEPNYVVEMIGLFFENTPLLITKMQTSLVDKQLDKVRDAAHQLKSSSLHLGALKLSMLCRNVESMIRVAQGADISDEVAPHLVKIEQEYLQRVVPELESEREKVQA